MIKEGPFYIDWLGEEREVVKIKIDDIYCKHESNWGSYRNNYRNQLKSIANDVLENKRNIALCKTLDEQGWLYPIAVVSHEAPSPQGPSGYICLDGHHRIKAHLTLGHDTILSLIYKDGEEAIKAKLTPYTGDQHNTTIEDFKDSKSGNPTKKSTKPKKASGTNKTKRSKKAKRSKVKE